MREFVATPLDAGFSVKAQVTGQDLVGGLRFHVTKATPSCIPPERPNTPGFDDSLFEMSIWSPTSKLAILNVLPSDRVFEVMERVEDMEDLPGIIPV